MADFMSGFWSVFITVVTAVSLAAIGLFAIGSARGKKPKGERPETMGHVWDGDLSEYNNPLPHWWLNLFYITLVFGAVYLVLYPGLGSFAGVLGWTGIGQYEEEMAEADRVYGPLFQTYLTKDLQSLAADPKALKMGKRLYANYCAACHGADAGGALGFPDLTDDDWLYGGAPEVIEISILEGRAGVMPPWEGVIAPEDLADVTAYVRGLSGNPVDAAAAGRGKIVFDTTCAVCHGADGRGNPALGAPNLTDAIWLYGGSERRVAESIAKGRQGRMPEHDDFLGEAKVHLLAAYVYSLSAGKAPASD
ncbi:MAG: cytochrome-c oxidase, cbb3-type subunit III [Gammaproteobacteria bacterium]